MSSRQKQKLINAFFAGVAIGGLLIFISDHSRRVNEAFDTIQSISLSVSALFTAWWAYKTFAHPEKRQDVILLIEALQRYELAVLNYIVIGNVYRHFIKTGVETDFYNVQLSKVNLEKDDSISYLKHLQEKSFYLSDSAEVNLVLKVLTYDLSDLDSFNIFDFNSAIFDMKSILKKELRSGF